jgi:hypothetical protein
MSSISRRASLISWIDRTSLLTTAKASSEATSAGARRPRSPGSVRRPRPQRPHRPRTRPRSARPAQEHHYSPHPLVLLRVRCKRPRSRRAEQRDEIASPHRHSITSSASASSLFGMVRPIARAVAKLMTNSSLVERATGRSTGFSPLRIRPT